MLESSSFEEQQKRKPDDMNLRRGLNTEAKTDANRKLKTERHGERLDKVDKK